MLYATLGISAILAALLVYRYDLFEKEPWWMLLLAVILGFGSMFPIGWLEDTAITQLLAVDRPSWGIALIASTHEELGRLLVALLMVVFFRRHFNDPIDGLIYRSMIGLGMAVAESLSYLSLWRVPASSILPGSEVIRLSGHLVMSGITCFGVGMVTMRMRHWVRVAIGCVLFSLLIHFLWDWVAFEAQRSSSRAAWLTIAAIAIMASGMFVYGVLVVIGTAWSRRLHAPGSTRRVWGWPIDVLLARSRLIDWHPSVEPPRSPGE